MDSNATLDSAIRGAPSVEDALMAWGELEIRQKSLGRDAEEREWQEIGLFYQRRQWLEWKEGERRYTQLKPDKRKPRPMPVSNYFAKTINSNANQLGATLVRVTATPKDDDQKTRRAADYAEMAKDAIDTESNIRVLNPLLAKHTAMWGIGITKDTIDTTSDPEAMDEMQMESNGVVGCLDCGGVNEMEDGQLEGDDDLQQHKIPCPDCQSMNTAAWQRKRQTSVSQYVSGKGKIKTEVVPVFEVYLPRDCQNANLAGKLIHRYRKPISGARRLWGDKADKLKADDAGTNTSETRMDFLKSLTAYTFAERANAETATITEIWAKWDEIPKRLQDAIEDDLEPQDDGEEEGQYNDEYELPEQDMGDQQEGEDGDLDQMKKAGIFFIYSQGVLLQWGANPFIDPDTDESFFPFTFYLWDIDPANVYPKGTGSDLVPLQKRLNRLDSLIELAMMTNAVGKWLWPKTQNNNKPPSGDPADVAEYDVIGDGKVKPEFVNPNPLAAAVWQLRAAILTDFQQLGLSLGIGQGQASSDAAFRTVAYLGAKQAEQLNTQRYLWESAHCMRYKKTLCMAKLFWDADRQAKVAGPNGKYLYETFMGDDLRGMYELDFVPNSSVPKTIDEKMQMMQMMVSVGLVDITDPAVRQYIFDLSNLEGVNLAQELQFRKAERDLESVKRGEMPVQSPYQDWNIQLKIFANFTLTEEFEALDPMLQSYVLGYVEYVNQYVSIIQQQAQMSQMQQQMGPAMASDMMNSLGGGNADPNNKKLAKIPGETIAPQGAESAATSQGSNFAQSMGA